MLLLHSLFPSSTIKAQLATGQSKFLGNIVAASVPSNFNTYWNQVTPENSGKWGSVEATRDQMNWGQLQTAYSYAKTRGYKFKQHTLVWGSQFPNWLSSLSQADQRAEIIEWYQAMAQQFPNLDFIDVVNEPIKTPCPFKNALGGNGSTGWDWVIESFRLARQYFPNAKLLINEYGTENDASARNQYITIINLLKSRGYLDGIGIQSHYFNLDNMSASQMTTCLNAYAATGVDIYISELDITGGGTDAGQLAKYQQLFPVLWNHASVKGVTLWGYIVGQTWRTGTGLINSNGTERPAMTWLKNFMAGATASLTVSPTSLSRGSAAGSSPITVTSNTNWSVTDNQNWMSTSVTSGSNNGSFTISVTANTATASRSGIVTVTGGSITRTVNVTQAGTGGGNRTITVRARGINGSERIELRVNNAIVTSWTLTTGMANYTATAGTGTVRVQFINDASNPNRDVQVDYVATGNTTFQSENQRVNTGAYINGSCGGGGNSEWLQCNGYIEYAGSSTSARAVTDPIVILDEEPLKKAIIGVYPNPVTALSFDITLGELTGITKLQITDLSGKIIKKINVTNQSKVTISLNVSPGTYIIHGINGTTRFTRKISII